METAGAAKSLVPPSIHGGLCWQRMITCPESYSHVVCADVNDAYYPPAPAVLEALLRWQPTINHSPDSLCRSYVNAVAEHVNVDPSRIVAGSGSSELLHAVITHFVRSGDEVILQDPTYGEYARSIAAAGGCAVKVPLAADFSTATASILDRVTDATKLIVVCNPTILRDRS